MHRTGGDYRSGQRASEWGGVGRQQIDRGRSCRCGLLLPAMKRIFLVALLIAALPSPPLRPATAQSTSTGMQAVPQDAIAQLRRLRVQINEMSDRIRELEKQRLEFLKDKAAEAADEIAKEAKSARVEQRLASLEKALAGEKSSAADGKKSAPAEFEQPMTVTAPFVVKDRAGKAIMVVQEGAKSKAAPGGSRGLYIYGLNQSDASAHVGTESDDVGRIYVAHTGAPRPDVILSYDAATGPLVRLNAPTSNGRIAQLDKRGFSYYGGTDHPLVELRAKDGRGLLLLNGADGGNKVEAGSLASGKGYVLVHPWQARTGLAGNPSVLMGGKSGTD